MRGPYHQSTLFFCVSKNIINSGRWAAEQLPRKNLIRDKSLEISARLQNNNFLYHFSPNLSHLRYLFTSDYSHLSMFKNKMNSQENLHWGESNSSSTLFNSIHKSKLPPSTNFISIFLTNFQRLAPKNTLSHLFPLPVEMWFFQSEVSW